MNFDIVIPVYNKEATIGELLDLLLSASSFFGKIFLVDDCSTDGSFEILNSYMERHPSVVISNRLECNSGPQVARMYGASLSDKDWLMFIDGDDLVETVSFPKINELLSQVPLSVDLFYGHTEIFRNGISKRNSIKSSKGTIFNSLISLLKMPSPTMSGIVVRKNIIKLMDVKNCEWGEDIVFYTRAINSSSFSYFPMTIGLYRQFEDGRGVGGGTIKRRMEFIRCLKHYVFENRFTISGIMYLNYYFIRVICAWLIKLIRTKC